MANQVDQSQVFLQKHKLEVIKTAAKLVEAAEHFLKHVGKIMFDPNELNQATEFCKNEDLHGLFKLLRPRATVFVSGGYSDVFWAWIDGVGFFFDAEGSQWPYMTHEVRRQSLQWAQEEALAVMELAYAG